MNKLMLLVIVLLCVSVLSCDLLNPSSSNTTEHKMYVFSNTAQAFYLVDFKTYSVVKRIPLEVPEGVDLVGMELSTDRNHLIFRTRGPFPDPPLGFILYDIKEEKFNDIFYTGHIHGGPVSFIADQNDTALGLIYTHLRDSGTYAIDLLERRVTGKISDEHDFRMQKRLSISPNKEWEVIHKIFSGTGDYNQIEIYSGGTAFGELEFILGEAGKDSIAIYDLVFSKDSERLFATYQLSDGRSRDIESYFGSYDLRSGELHQSDLRFPWSLSGYFLAIDPMRNNLYIAGNNGSFHIIDSDLNILKESVLLPIQNFLSLQPKHEYHQHQASINLLITAQTL